MNLDKQIQRLLCYRYTIPQGEVHNRWGSITVKIAQVAAVNFAAAGSSSIQISAPDAG